MIDPVQYVCPKCCASVEKASKPADPIRCPFCGETIQRPTNTTLTRSLETPDPDPQATTDEDNTSTPFRSSADLPGSIGRFEIRRELGEGAFGKVYEAHDPQLDRAVAIKVAKLGRGDSEQRIKRFLREAKSAAGLRHPNIVPVYEFGEDGDHFYIVAAFIQGRTLQGDRRLQMPADLKRSARIIRQLADALAYAHAQGIVHRDVKPANVMLDDKDEPMLMDFGLATRQDEAEKLTHAGAVLGTPLYMSPEQARGQGTEAQPATDQYSLGVMLYEMIAGRPPFEGTPELVMFHHIETEPVSPRKHNAAISRDLETICLKCLEKEPTKRYATCQALGDDLRRWLDEEPITARRIGTIERTARWCRKRPMSAALTASLVATILISVGVSWGLTAWALGEADRADYEMGMAKDSASKAEKSAKWATEQQILAEKATKEAKEQTRVAKENLERAAFQKYSRHIADALRAGKEKKRLLAEQELASCRWDFIDWEFHYVSTLVQGSNAGQLALDTRDAKQPPDSKVPLTIRTCTFFENGNQLRAAITTGIEYSLWDISDRTRLQSRKLPDKIVSYSPDGSRFVIRKSESMYSVWDASIGNEQVAFRADNRAQMTQLGFNVQFFDSSFGFSSDSTALAYAETDNEGWKIKVWNAVAKRVEVVIPVADGRIPFCTKFSPDGRRLAVLFVSKEKARPSSQVIVIDSQTGHEILTVPPPSLQGSIDSFIQFDADSEYMAVFGLDHAVRVFGLRERRLISEIDSNLRVVTCVAMSPSHRRIACAGFGVDGSGTNIERRLSFHDLRSGDVSLTFPIAESVLSLTFFNNGKSLAYCTDGGEIKVLTPAVQQFLKIGNSNDSIVGISPSLTCFFTNRGALGKMTTGQMHHQPFGLDLTAPLQPAFSENGDLLAMIADERRLRVCSLPDHDQGVSVALYDGYPGLRINSLSFSRDSKNLAIAGGQSVLVVDVDSGKTHTIIENASSRDGHYAALRDVQFLSEGKIVAYSTEGIRIWHAKSGNELLRIAGTEKCSRVSASHNGSSIAAVMPDYSVKAWESNRGEEVREFKGPQSPVICLTFSPDGRLLAAAATTRKSTSGTPPPASKSAVWKASRRACGFCSSAATAKRWPPRRSTPFANGT